MKNTSSKHSENNAKDTVQAFIKALNDEDFKMARTLVTDDLSFVGVLGSRDSAEAYFKDMEKMKMKYKITKAVSEDNDVCLMYDFTIGDVTAFGIGWYHLKNGKISSFKVIFDPRPFLDDSKKKQNQ